MDSLNGIGGGGTTSTPAGPLGGSGVAKDDFLRLLVAQLQHQDPMSPQDDPQFMGVMAQFSTLEQVTNLVDGFERTGWSSQVSESVSLIGKTVTWQDTEGIEHSGIATSVSFADGQILVTVDGVEVDPGQIGVVAA